MFFGGVCSVDAIISKLRADKESAESQVS